MAEDNPQKPEHQKARAVAPGLSRFIIVVPVLSLYVGAVTLVVVGGIDTVGMVLKFLSDDPPTKKQALLAVIELADLFLLAVVVYIIALGLYELFIDPNIKLPEWLHFNDIDDLKHRLASVVIVVLAVMFLGSAIEYKDARDLALRGVGTAAVVFALSYFLRGPQEHR